MLPKKIVKALTDYKATKYISVMTFWELALLLETKPHVFKLKIPLSNFISLAIQDLQLIVLNITPEHSQRFYEIQQIKDHKGMFDRMIRAQAASTNLTLLSTDRKFIEYPVKIFEY